MQELLLEGQSLEFFVEGGRSRSGKALYPKGGLLSVVVDAYLQGKRLKRKKKSNWTFWKLAQDPVYGAPNVSKLYSYGW